MRWTRMAAHGPLRLERGGNNKELELNVARFSRPGRGKTSLAGAPLGAAAGVAAGLDRRRGDWLSGSLCSPVCLTK